MAKCYPPFLCSKVANRAHEVIYSPFLSPQFLIKEVREVFFLISREFTLFIVLYNPSDSLCRQLNSHLLPDCLVWRDNLSDKLLSHRWKQFLPDNFDIWFLGNDVQQQHVNEVVGKETKEKNPSDSMRVNTEGDENNGRGERGLEQLKQEMLW